MVFPYSHLGYLYCGVNYLPTAEKAATLAQMHQTINRSIKLRVYQGDGNPVDVLTAVLSGLDLFESSYSSLIMRRYPYKLAMAKIGMDIDCGVDASSKTEAAEDCKAVWELCDRKEIKYIDFNEGACEGVMTPLQSKCGCFTCTHHTRGYIHHLVACDEINWSMLLMMYLSNH